MDDDILADQMMADVDQGNFSDSEDSPLPKQKKLKEIPLQKAQSHPVESKPEPIQTKEIINSKSPTLPKNPG